MIPSAARVPFSVIALALASGCGYIGEPQYPALNIINRVPNLSAIERGNHLDVNFSIPPLTTEGLVVKSVGAIDLRVGPKPGPDFHIEDWAAAATHIDVAPPAKPGPVQAKVPIGKFVGQEVIVAVRVANNKGRVSEWSNLVTRQIDPPLATPAGLKPENQAEGVKLSWSAPGQTSFKIYRSSEKEPQPSQVGTSTEPSYLDTTTAFGNTYEYFVQGVNGETESEAAGPVSIATKDEFPPAVPMGLTGTAGLNAVELAWARNSEPDFRGYRVYRALADGPFEKLADLVEAPNYSDRAVEAGKRYRYVISAVDQAGNESAKTPPVEVTLP